MVGVVFIGVKGDDTVSSGETMMSGNVQGGASSRSPGPQGPPSSFLSVPAMSELRSTLKRFLRLYVNVHDKAQRERRAREERSKESLVS